MWCAWSHAAQRYDIIARHTGFTTIEPHTDIFKHLMKLPVKTVWKAFCLVFLCASAWAAWAQGPDPMELSERPKWELSPVEQLRVAAYRRDLGNAEMRQGRPEKVPCDWRQHGSTWHVYLYQILNEFKMSNAVGILEDFYCLTLNSTEEIRINY